MAEAAAFIDMIRPHIREYTKKDEITMIMAALYVAHETRTARKFVQRGGDRVGELLAADLEEFRSQRILQEVRPEAIGIPEERFGVKHRQAEHRTS